MLRRIAMFAVLTGVTAVGLPLAAGPAAAEPLKAQLNGVADRKGPPPASYQDVVRAYVVQVPWASLQPTELGGIADSAPTDPTAGNAIDAAIGYARTHPGVRIKLRVYAGKDAPEWVKNLPVTRGTGGPVSICDPATSVCGTVDHFWESSAQDAYRDLQAKLAAKYDAAPELQEVAITGCTTLTGEPMIRQSNVAANRSAYAAGGYTEAGNLACLDAAIGAHEAWQQTRSAFAFNPYLRWSEGSQTFTTDASVTEATIDQCREALDVRCVVGNNSLGKKQAVFSCDQIDGAEWATRDVNARMYTKIKCAGAPIYFQTAAAPKLAAAGTTLGATLDFALGLGAHMVELPLGYSNPQQPAVYLTPDQLACYDSALAGRGGCPPPESPPTPPTDTPPTAPTSVTATVPTGGTTVQLSWTAATDDKGIASYTVSRDGAVIGTTTTTRYDDSTASVGTHSYTVVATDTAGQPSDASAAASVTVPDRVAPTAPSGLTARQSSSTVVALAWSAASDNVGVTGYRVLRNGVFIGSTAATSFTDSTVRRRSTYTYTVQAYDDAGNVGPSSASVTLRLR